MLSRIRKLGEHALIWMLAAPSLGRSRDAARSGHSGPRPCRRSSSPRADRRPAPAPSAGSTLLEPRARAQTRTWWRAARRSRSECWSGARRGPSPRAARAASAPRAERIERLQALGQTDRGGRVIWPWVPNSRSQRLPTASRSVSTKRSARSSASSDNWRIECRIGADRVELDRGEPLFNVFARPLCRQIGVLVDVGPVAVLRVQVGVGSRSLVDAAAEQLVDRLAQLLADDVPAGHLDAAENAHERGIGALGVAAGVDDPPQPLDLERIGAHDMACADCPRSCARRRGDGTECCRPRRHLQRRHRSPTRKMK